MPFLLAQQVAAINTARELDNVGNFMQAAINLPYREAQQAFGEIEGMIKSSRRPQNAFEVITQALLPALSTVPKPTTVRLQNTTCC